jgi:dihydroorotate dehydrogenase electron transfer subunit
VPYQARAKIIANQRVAPDYYRLVIEAPLLSRAALPGQFVHVRVGNRYDPLLRRPFSINTCDQGRGYLYLLYRVVGSGTELLAAKLPGEELDILGPLGKGFTWEQEMENIVVVGGGIGIAPLLGAAQTAFNQGKRVLTLLGARNAAYLVDQREFAAVSQDLWLATDDGSIGYQGPVTHLLAQLLQEQAVDLVLACGPHAMLQAVAGITRELGVKCQVSLEERMGCGLGACRGCACRVKTDTGQLQYKMVCHDGPVFAAEEVMWDA